MSDETDIKDVADMQMLVAVEVEKRILLALNGMLGPSGFAVDGTTSYDDELFALQRRVNMRLHALVGQMVQQTILGLATGKAKQDAKQDLTNLPTFTDNITGVPPYETQIYTDGTAPTTHQTYKPHGVLYGGYSNITKLKIK